MKRVAMVLLLMPAISAALGGCVAGMAVSAVSAVARGARGGPVSNAQLMPQARAACTAEAQRHGEVRIIDAQQVSIERITVWGTVTRDGARRSFDCSFGTKVVRFKLRDIPQR